MTDTIMTLAIIGGCLLFVGLKAIKTLQEKGSGCGCGCARGCAAKANGCDAPTKIPTAGNKRRAEQ